MVGLEHVQPQSRSFLLAVTVIFCALAAGALAYELSTQTWSKVRKRSFASRRPAPLGTEGLEDGCGCREQAEMQI
jgi:hypothetical protein